MDQGRRFVLTVTLLAGLFMTTAGVAAPLTPGWFAATAGFLVANTTQAINHAIDLDLGGHSAIPGAGRPVAADRGRTGRAPGPARLGRRRGHPAASPALARFLRHKTVLATTYRRDGRPLGPPATLAVDGGHSYIRSFEKAGKTRRIHNNPRVELAPSPTAPLTCWPTSTPCCTARWRH
jgi:hypothetical protein